ncbi:MAG: two-component response regulator [Myxococcales bacterium]|nr:two-component response regulator [Myxococcales bacterium]
MLKAFTLQSDDLQKDPDAVPSRPVSPLVPAKASRQGPVLIVEDDEDVAATLKGTIEDLGYRAEWAANGREALARMDEMPLSLLLVDLFMPVMGGIEFLHVIKRSPTLSAIPKVVMTTANDQMIAVKEDIMVLHKPIDFATLTHLLEQHCERAETTA